MKHFIITGTSRGLGAALAGRLAVAGSHVVCVSRRANPELAELAARNGALLSFIPYDLGDTTHIDALVDEIFTGIDTTRAEAIVLVNNAGTLEPIKPLARCTGDALVRNLDINLVAPILLTAGFLRKTEGLTCDRRIISISSGAGRKPYFGWSAYCTAKAGIDMVTRCAALESEGQENPVKIVSFGPGVMDTEMQAAIRGTAESDFVQLQKFLDRSRAGTGPAARWRRSSNNTCNTATGRCG